MQGTRSAATKFRAILSPLVILAGFIAVAVLPLAIGTGSHSAIGQLVIYFMWIALAESWNLVGGYAGLLNLGLVAFFVLGAVTCSLALFAGIPFLYAMLIAGFSCALMGIALIPTFRLRTEYFAIGTLVVPVIVKPLVEYFSQKESFTVPLDQIISTGQLYYLGVVMAAATVFGIFFLMRTRVGIALRAMGENEAAAESLGVRVLFYKTVALVSSGFIAGVAGAYYLQFIGSASTTLFQNLNYSLFPIFMVIIGGAGTFEGPIIGAVLFGIIDYYSPTVFSNSTADTLVFSIVIMAVAVLLPRGIFPSLAKFSSQRTSHSAD